MKETFWWLHRNWQQLLFALVGLMFLAACFWQVLGEEFANAGVLFGMAFLSFLYSNLSRFKRFKGLGFEAELWEEKQREAEQLIERLKSMVAVYTREIVLGKVMTGRWGTANRWKEHWALYEELVREHGELGQEIDFTELKERLDKIFIFDMAGDAYQKTCEIILRARQQARDKINDEFGSPIRDVEGHRQRMQQLSAIPEGIPNLIQIEHQKDLAHEILAWANEAKNKLKSDFNIDLAIDPKLEKELRSISQAFQSRPIKVTEELIALADGRD